MSSSCRILSIEAMVTVRTTNVFLLCQQKPQCNFANFSSRSVVTVILANRPEKMGAQQSTQIQKELKFFRDLASLDRNTVMRMIIEMNEAGLDLNGIEVRVEVVGYTDDQILWRQGIRFSCTVKDLKSNDTVSQEINLRQFLPIHHNVMTWKQHLNSVDPRPAALTRSQPDINEDDEVCCVCLDRFPQVSLPCAHSFCPHCIQEWQLRSNSCPLCREESTIDEQWFLEDAPDLTETERELRITLANLLRV